MAIITGNDRPNTLRGTNLDDLLRGLGADDTLSGLLGNDRLDGGLGADRMLGGGGNDIYVVDNAHDQVVESGGGGTDTVLASVSFTLGAHVENLTLTGLRPSAGTGNDLANVIRGNNANNILRGAAGNDALVGAGGNDRLDGGAGADRMVGGPGNDTYMVAAGDRVTEGAGAGTDLIVTSLNFDLSTTPQVENLTLAGTAINGTGNSLNNAIVGTIGFNVLIGAHGDDALTGGGGFDTLFGGAGADRFIYRAASDAPVSQANIFVGVLTAEVIVGFDTAQGDRVDLSLIDANTGAVGNQSFHFIGADSFTNTAGELRTESRLLLMQDPITFMFTPVGAYVVAAGDVNGDGVADFEISRGVGTPILFAAGDFIM